MAGENRTLNYRLVIAVLSLFVLLHKSDCQYIHAIHDYKPAPGQFINAPGGTNEAALGIIGEKGGMVSLGAFGGFIVFSFEYPVENHPDNPYGVDFVIFGNATIEFSEAGIVSVMRDENANGLPDDIWYELAGSDHSLSSSIKNYSIEYTDPQTDIAADVYWEDNYSNSGKISANSFHTQSYYPGAGFDYEFYSESCTFSGSKIEAETNFSDGYRLRSFPREYGYADNIHSTGLVTDLPDNPYTNEVEGMGGDAMDISWAIDGEANKVSLDKIHFVRVHTAVLGEAGSLGELSTEIHSAIDIAPAPGLSNDISSFDSDGLVTIFPNPFMNEINIKGIKRSKIELFSSEGRILYKSEMVDDSHSINAENLLPGVYFLKIYTNQQTEFFTLLKASN